MFSSVVSQSHYILHLFCKSIDNILKLFPRVVSFFHWRKKTVLYYYHSFTTCNLQKCVRRLNLWFCWLCHFCEIKRIECSWMDNVRWRRKDFVTWYLASYVSSSWLCKYFKLFFFFLFSLLRIIFYECYRYLNIVCSFPLQYAK